MAELTGLHQTTEAVSLSLQALLEHLSPAPTTPLMPQQMQNAQDATGTPSPDACIAIHSEEVANGLEEVSTESEDFSKGNR
ncbi:hypothetical protein E4T56_gene1514 [Termitomyces sp. T112]|nr:hypothetical protein E4T56_gene1514 [Termitomyces sp. T112]